MKEQIKQLNFSKDWEGWVMTHILVRFSLTCFSPSSFWPAHLLIQSNF